MKKTNYPLIIMTKEIKLLFKSKRRIFLLLIIPILILVGGVISSSSIYFNSNTVDPTQVWVINQSPSNYTADLINLWASINNTAVKEVNINYTTLQTTMNFEVVVVIPGNFSELISTNQTAQLQIVYNANDTTNEHVALSILQMTNIYELYQVQLENPTVQFNIIEPHINRVAKNKNGVDEDLAQILLIIPVYIIFFVVISPISLVLISVTIEREQKTLEVLFLQPVKRRAIVIGKILYGLFLVLATLILDILAGGVALLLFKVAITAKNEEAAQSNFNQIFQMIHAEELIVFLLGIAAIAIVIIAFAVLLSLLAKDEKEANMISGIIPMLIMGMVFIIFVVPIAEMGLVGQLSMSIVPILGVIVAIYLSTLAGSVVPLAYLAIIAQLFWSALIVAMTARISEAESILELSYSKAFTELKHAIFRRKHS